MTTKKSGFTLIELLIVLSIVVIFSALSLAYYREFNEQRKLDAEAKQLIDVLNLASKKSRASDLSPNPSCSDFRGYGVNIQDLTTHNTYKLQFKCAAELSDVQLYKLRDGLTLSGLGVLFMPLFAETNPSTITITNTVTGKCINIQINQVGTVEELPNCP